MTDVAAPQGQEKNRISAVRLQYYIMEICLLALVVALIFVAPGFATADNLLNVLRSVSMLGIVAFGMTAVIISSEIDLSVGAGIALAGCIAAYIVDALSPSIGDVSSVILGSAAAISACMAAGAVTGVLKAAFNVPTFITTLGLFTALRGMANLITDGFPLASFPSWFGFFGNGSWLGIPFPAFVFLLVFVAMHFLMGSTTFGRSVYAVGGNAEAARLSGISVGFVKTATLVLTGALTGLSGLLIASQIGSGTGTTATGEEKGALPAL